MTEHRVKKLRNPFPLASPSHVSKQILHDDKNSPNVFLFFTELNTKKKNIQGIKKTMYDSNILAGYSCNCICQWMETYNTIYE